MDAALTGQDLTSLSQTDLAAMMVNGGISLTAIIIILAIVVFYAIVFWKLFKKAGYEGYESLVKGHNGYLMILMSGKPGWWYFLFLIPVVMFFFTGMVLGSYPALTIIGMSLTLLSFLYLYIVVSNGIAKNFGKRVGFALGLIILPFIFYPILALGTAKYKKTA